MLVPDLTPKHTIKFQLHVHITKYESSLYVREWNETIGIRLDQEHTVENQEN